MVFEHYVLKFDVAVHDAKFMQIVESFHEAFHDGSDFLQIQAFFLVDPFCEIFAFEKFRDYVDNIVGGEDMLYFQKVGVIYESKYFYLVFEAGSSIL
jgi:hypothetical protein